MAQESGQSILDTRERGGAIKYDKGFYDMIRPGVESSAKALVPTLINLLEPESVIDVGCGEGWWAYEFFQHGCRVIGVDNGAIPTSPLNEKFRAVDLTKPFPDLGKWDLAVCLEVAEHLPVIRAEGFIRDLCNLAPDIIFSAAIPGQGGVGHINEQWPDYWVKLFELNGYAVTGMLRWLIWDDDRIENWYRQNLLLATSHPDHHYDMFGHPSAEPFRVVHPVLYDARRGR